jgi:hypothetical protein
MSDIFLSYTRADKHRAELFSELFARQGWSVWWDRQIPPGRSFDETIEYALNSARCVVVLWSQDSVSSRWVRTEAAEGLAREILVPVLIDPVPIPLEFKRVEAADLSDWQGSSPHPELDALLKSIAGLLGGPPPVGAKPAASSTTLRNHPWWKTTPGLATATTGLIAIGFTLVVALSRSGIFDRVDQHLPFADEGTSGRAAFSEQLGLTPKHVPSKATRINLLAPENGGHLVVASNETWAVTIDGKEEGAFIEGGTNIGQEAVYAFKDKQSAIFDTFSLFIPGSGDNVKDFELLIANDLSPGSFEPIGRFQPQNVKLFKTPYQAFEFPAVKAKYLKFKLISSYSAGYTWLSEFQLLGRLDER